MDERIDYLETECRNVLQAQGFKNDQIETLTFLHMRYEGTDCALMCLPDLTSSEMKTKHGDFLKTFIER